MTRQALGKGLGALIPDMAPVPVAPAGSPEASRAEATPDATADTAAPALSGTPVSPATASIPAAGAPAIVELPMDQIRNNPYQPRTSFNSARLDELAESIRTSGLIQPVIVRRVPEGVGYQLIAGERRFLAAQRAGLAAIPAFVRTASRREMLEFAIVENLQREDLHAIDEARAYQRMATEFDLTQEQIAVRVGKDRTTVTNALRLLGLPESVQEMVAEGALTPGHARALLGLDSISDQEALARDISKRGLSVRQVEELMAERKNRRTGRSTRRHRAHPTLARWEDALRQNFGTQVRIVGGTARGKIEIAYFNEGDLERILEVAGVLSRGPSDVDMVPPERPTIME